MIICRKIHEWFSFRKYTKILFSEINRSNIFVLQFFFKCLYRTGTLTFTVPFDQDSIFAKYHQYILMFWTLSRRQISWFFSWYFINFWKILDWFLYWHTQPFELIVVYVRIYQKSVYYFFSELNQLVDTFLLVKNK